MTDWRIEQGDSLALLQALEPGSVDAVVTDPPYAATGESSSYVTLSAVPAELQFYRAWLSEWLRALAPVMADGAALWLTIDWRGALALEQAACPLGWSRPKVGIWDRGGLGMGFAARNTFECWAITYRPGWQPQSRAEPDVWRHPWSPGNRSHGHSAEKPVALMRRAVRHITPPGGLVLDPFAGSGSTGAAALLEGRRFIGFELSEHYASVARERLASIDPVGARSTAEQPTLFGGA